MKKFCVVIDELKKLCDVATGTDVNYYRSIGMEERDVERGYDGNWYLSGYAPKIPLTLEKEKKLNELRVVRDAKDFENITTEKGEFEVDSVSQIRISNRIRIMNDTEKRDWTLASGEKVLVTKAELNDVLSSVGTRSDVLHNKWLSLKGLVEEAETVEEVEAISWDIVNA